MADTVATVVQRKNNDNFQLLVDPSAYTRRKHFSFNAKVAEGLFDKYFGANLSRISLGTNVHFVDRCKRMLKRFSADGFSYGFFSSLSNECFGGAIPPSAMFYKDETEFHNSLMLMYQLSYAHYVLGMHYRVKGQFPIYCCGISASNLLTALWEAGIVSAVKVCDDPDDHCYNVIPFVLRDKKGVIIVDPTSDQLIKKRSRETRNRIMITTKKKWSYVTDYKEGANLYPTAIQISTAYGQSEVAYGGYIKEALKNPVVVM